MRRGYTVRELRVCLAWAKTNPTETLHIPWADWTQQTFTGAAWRQWFRQCLMAKINRHEPASRGRKDAPDWWRAQRQAASRLNTPRLLIDWLPADLARRFAHRLRRNRDDLSPERKTPYA